MKFRNATRALLCLAAALASFAARAEDGPLLVRLRAVYIGPANGSDAIPALGVPADAISVTSKTIPEVDVTLFFTKNFSAELVLTYPQQHEVKISGVSIGTFRHLPPSLLAQWHFMPGAAFSPYVGVGANFTLLSDVNLHVPGVGALDLDSTSFGLAAGAGFDVKVGNHWVLNADAKWVQIRSGVYLQANGAQVSSVKVDPWLLGAGLGYRF